MKTIMKKIFFPVLVMLSGMAYAQDFGKNMTTARSSYSSGNLEDARFAMEQMLRDLDLAIGKEILKLLPLKAGTLAANEKADQVSGGSAGGLGLMVHREYGTAPKTANIEIINNSPLINSIQSILTMPVIGGMVRDENQKVVKVQGYKSLLNRTLREDGKTDYELQVPMNNTLLTVRMTEASEGDITSFADTLPLAKIVQLAQ